MNNIRLFIENEEVELSEQSILNINKEFEELSNPTIIINDWSRTIQIPFTTNNNKIFGNLNNPDRLIVSGEGSTGLLFDPYNKLSFRLEFQDSVIMTGYAKNIYTTQENGVGYYNITLNGELGKVFQEMQRITFDPAIEETKYLLNTQEYVNSQINAKFVYDCWQRVTPPSLTLRKINEPNYNVYDVVGFVPNNSYDEGFNYDTYQLSTYQSEKFEDTLNSINFQDKTGISADTVLGEGLTPRGLGEFRSYLQTPYMYFNKFVQLFLNKSTELTDYTFNLDSDWFNSDNVYWNDLCMGLLPFSLNKVTTSDEPIDTDEDKTLGTYNRSGDALSNYIYVPYLDTKSGIFINFKDTTEYATGNRIHQKAYQTLYIDAPISVNVFLDSAQDIIDLYTSEYAYFEFGAECRISGTNTVLYTDTCKVYSGARLSTETNNKKIWNTQGNRITGYSQTYTFNCHLVIPSTTEDRDVTIYTYSHFGLKGSPEDRLFRVPNEILAVCPTSVKTTLLQTQFTITNSREKHSNSYFTLNDLWDNNYTPFDVFLNYCKLFRLVFDIDFNNKQISILPANKYFSDYMVTKYDEKLDMSKSFTNKPISFEHKYVLFNYSDSDAKYSQSYKQEYGVNYGDLKLITDYQFNTDTSKLFDSLPTTIVYSPNILSWTVLYDNKRIVYTFGKEIYLHNSDKDNKVVNTFGEFWFVNTTKWDSSNYLRNVRITDDTYLQTSTQTYFYSQDADSSSLFPEYYKQPTLVKKDCLCLVNVPSKNYTYDSSYFSGVKSIYTQYWENYINERYNKNNKLITCYLKLSQFDFSNFKFNKFIQIGNQVYVVNKIYDYNPATSDSTKVDLINIQDLNGYTKINN